jgi:hypothetical protein
VLGSVDSLTVEILVASVGLQWQAESVDEQLPAPGWVGRDNSDARYEKDVHASPLLRRVC